MCIFNSTQHGLPSRVLLPMCLAAFAAGLNDRFPFVLLANRDEGFERDAAAMAWWPGRGAEPGLLAGRDLSAGGTWLGLTASGRLALVTNVREPGRVLAGSPSRGELVPQWLQSAHAAHDASALLGLGEVARNGFNLLVADLQSVGSDHAASDPVSWLSNRPALQQRGLGPGVHGVSNAALDTPWPKLVRLKQRLQSMVSDAHHLPDLQAAGFAALADPQFAADAELPATGLPLLREWQVSPAFIRIVGDDPAVAVYGTRCATMVMVQNHAKHRSMHVVERSFGVAGGVVGEVRFDWNLPSA
jgi:uncharacterized protein with NRDE domain